MSRFAEKGYRKGDPHWTHNSSKPPKIQSKQSGEWFLMSNQYLFCINYLGLFKKKKKIICRRTRQFRNQWTKCGLRSGITTYILVLLRLSVVEAQPHKMNGLCHLFWSVRVCLHAKCWLYNRKKTGTDTYSAGNLSFLEDLHGSSL